MTTPRRVTPSHIKLSTRYFDDNHSANGSQQNNECVYSTMHRYSTTNPGHYILLPMGVFYGREFPGLQERRETSKEKEEQ